MLTSFADVIGVLTNIGEMTSITVKRTNQQVNKRTITIEDHTGADIEVSLWGERAAQVEGWTQHMQYPVIAVKGAKVTSFNGHSLSTVAGSVITPNPDHEQSFTLRGWFDSNGRPTAQQHLSSGGGGNFTPGNASARGNDVRRTFAELTAHKEAPATETLYSQVKGSINYLKHDGTIHYLACPNPDCKNKKVDKDTGVCTGCHQNVNPVPRYILGVSAADHTGTFFLLAFVMRMLTLQQDNAG